MGESELDVFLNCPFDDDYRELFEAIVFSVTACGFRIRCALEEDDATKIRFEKLCTIIEACSYSIHDLSRTELNKDNLPRFNMPFELGLTMGAKVFGGKKHKMKSALILVDKPYVLPAYLSDLGGNDPRAHGKKSEKIIQHVRRYLGERPTGGPLPGPAKITEAFNNFRAALPVIAEQNKIKPEEIDAFDEYLDYSNFLAQFLIKNPVL